jgi:hypothetical protein
MTVWWCRGCGMEDTRAHESCSSCGSALQTADIEWLNDGDEGTETVFEIETEPIERAALVDALIANNIRHRWEGTDDLVVSDRNADAADLILDEVLGEEDEDDEGDDDVDDEFDNDIDSDDDPFEEGSDNGYEVLSRLFIATGGVMRSRSEDDIEEFTASTQEVLTTATPFGVDDETWADIQAAARNTSVALNADSKAPIDADIKALHNQVQTLV